MEQEWQNGTRARGDPSDSCGTKKEVAEPLVIKGRMSLLRHEPHEFAACICSRSWVFVFTAATEKTTLIARVQPLQSIHQRTVDHPVLHSADSENR